MVESGRSKMDINFVNRFLPDEGNDYTSRGAYLIFRKFKVA